MPAVTTKAPPSKLSTVIGQIRDAFDAMGDTGPGIVMVGKQYLEDFGVGSGPRILFVPDAKGKWGPPREMSNAASVTHSCDVYIRAPESGDELTRLDAAEALADRVIGMLKVAGTGGTEGGDYADDSPTDVDAYGADIALSFTYRRDVRHDPKRWGLPAPDADASDLAPNVPPGIAAPAVSLNPTTAPKNGGS